MTLEGGFWISKEIRVESEDSGERPKMLGGGYNARVGDRSPPSYSDGVR